MAVLYVIASAAPPVAELRRGLSALTRAGWDVCLTLTPTAASWLVDDLDELASACGRPVRTNDRRLGEPRPFPAADAYLAAPLTFNSLNKWALGISDNVALGTLNEALGADAPVAAVPYFKDQLGRHPQVQRSLDVLTGARVRMVDVEPADDAHAWWSGVAALLEDQAIFHL